MADFVVGTKTADLLASIAGAIRTTCERRLLRAPLTLADALRQNPFERLLPRVGAPTRPGRIA